MTAAILVQDVGNQGLPPGVEVCSVVLDSAWSLTYHSGAIFKSTTCRCLFGGLRGRIVWNAIILVWYFISVASGRYASH